MVTKSYQVNYSLLAAERFGLQVRDRLMWSDEEDVDVAMWARVAFHFAARAIDFGI